MTYYAPSGLDYVLEGYGPLFDQEPHLSSQSQLWMLGIGVMMRSIEICLAVVVGMSPLP